MNYLSWYALTSLLHSNTLKCKDWLSWLSKRNSRHTHQNRLKSSPFSAKVSLPPAKVRMFFPTHPWVREFWPRIYSLWWALDWGLLSKIL